jgi:hypothetical protein
VSKAPATAADAAWCHDPDGFALSLPRRQDKALPFDPAALPPDCAVVLDTNVYIARVANRLAAGEADLRSISSMNRQAAA